MTSKFRHALTVLGCALLGACASAPPLAPPETVAAKPAALCNPDCQLGRVLVGVASFRAMTPAELGAQADALRRAWLNDKSEENRLLYAGFLALAPAPHNDRSRALALLDVDSSASNGRGRLHPLAAVLIPLLQDARRQESEVVQLQFRLRDEVRRADANQQASDSLQKKLEALREIERGMLERPARKP